MAPMVAVNDGGDLDFYHVGGVLRIFKSGIPNSTRKIRVTFTGMTYVTGTYTVSNPGTSSATTMVSSGSHNYVEFTKSTDFDGVAVLNVPLPTGDYSACIGITVSYYDSEATLLDSTILDFPWLSVGRARGKSLMNIIDLSLVHPLTGEPMLRETANCYIVTEPGIYMLPLFYGNAVVDGLDNISTAAPAKSGSSNKGVFVNAYDKEISSGNIIADLKNCGNSLDTSGGRLIWSTQSKTSNALVIVESAIIVIDGVGYLIFSVPSDRFQAGSALIGIQKLGVIGEYVWAWHIWITNGRWIKTETYSNHEGKKFDFLNCPLGAANETTSTANFYQWGIPFPIPATNALYIASGATSFTYDSSNTITTLGKALSKPSTPRWGYDYCYTASGSFQAFTNMWDATQGSYGSINDKIVIKTIYDPSPAKMNVPRIKAFSGFTTTGENGNSSAGTLNVVGGFNSGWKFKKNSSDATGSYWAASGYRSSGGNVSGRGSYGYYWSAILNANNPSYSSFLLLTNSSVNTESYNSRFIGVPVRPILIEN